MIFFIDQLVPSPSTAPPAVLFKVVPSTFPPNSRSTLEISKEILSFEPIVTVLPLPIDRPLEPFPTPVTLIFVPVY